MSGWCVALSAVRSFAVIAANEDCMIEAASDDVMNPSSLLA
jgi:hypothetical protein